MTFGQKKYSVILILLIFLINFFFKLLYISSPSLWYDEIISVQDTLLDFGHIKHEAEWDKNPPFYHYLLWIWSKLLGISEFAVRSMSAFFSSITAVLIFIFMNKMSSLRNSIAATFVFSAHPFLYYYAQEARCFSLLLFLVTLNLVIIHTLINHPNYIKAFTLGVLNFLIFYTHYLAGLILFCQFLLIMFLFRKRIIFLLLIYLTPILLILLRFTRKQYDVLFFSQKMSAEKSNVPISTIDYLIEALDQLFVSSFFFLVLLVVLAVFLVKVIKRQEILTKIDLQFKLYIVFSPLICVMTLYLLGRWTNVFHGRYLIFTIPYLIISFFILIENTALFYSFIILFISFEFYNIKFNQSKGMDYRFCAFLTKEIQKKEDPIILLQTHDIVNLFTYYYNEEIFRSKERMSHEFLAKHQIYYIKNVIELKNLKLKENKPILFFQTYQKREDNSEIIKFFEERNFIKFTSDKIEGVNFSYLKPS
jgi:uncharacterized membrane protein